MGKFGKGLNRDSGPIDQPEGTWRYCKNAILKREIGGISNEGGTEVFIESPTGVEYLLLGKIPVGVERTILFSCSTAYPVRSQIGIIENNVYTELLNINVSAYLPQYKNLSLGFERFHNITGTYKYNSQGELIIYWVDGKNPPRTLNVNRQKTSVSTLIYSKPITDPAIDPYTRYYADILNLFPSSGSVPKIDQAEIVSGGSLLVGAYTLAIAYLDNELTPTNYISISKAVKITDEKSSGPSLQSDGAKDGSVAGKTIKWSIVNCNTNYEYIQPVIIQRTESANVSFILPKIKIPSTGAVTVNHTSISGMSSSTLDEVLIDNIEYFTASSISIFDSRMYLADLTTDEVNDFQPYANFIKSNVVFKDVDTFESLSLTHEAMNDGTSTDIVVNSYKDLNSGLPMGYKRGEVYSFYISFILNNGSMSRAFHIPGRAPESTETYEYNWNGNKFWGEYATTVYSDVGQRFEEYEVKDFHATSINGMNFWENKDETYPNNTNWNVIDGENPTVAADIHGEKVRHHHFPGNCNSDGTISSASFMKSTSTSLASNTSNANIVTNLVIEAFVDNEDPSDFLNTNSFYVSPTQDGLIDIGDQVYINGSYYEIISSTWLNSSGVNSYEITVSGGNFSYGVVNNTNGDPYWYYLNFTVYDALPTALTYVDDVSHKVRIMGIQFSDIKIPKSIAEKVQGFRIYRADRKHSERTSLGQSIVLPAKRSIITNRVGASNAVSGWLTLPFPWASSVSNESSYKSTSNISSSTFHVINGLTFYDFRLLREKFSIKHADYMQIQGRMRMEALTGPSAHYTPITGSSQTLASIYAVQTKLEGSRGPNYSNAWPFLIHKQGKTYVPGRSIYRLEGNFGADTIQNVGGESSMFFNMNTPVPYPVTGWSTAIASSSNTPTTSQRDIDPTSSEEKYWHLMDLKSFKRNVYLNFESHKLVYTGYEVAGEEFERFKLSSQDTSFPLHPLDTSGETNFTTEHIFGGDTYLSRQSVRSRWETNGRTYLHPGGSTPNDTNSQAASGLFTYIVESSDNIGMQHSEGIGTAYAPLYYPKQILWSLEKECLYSQATLASGSWGTFNSAWYSVCSCLDFTAHKTATHPGDVQIGIAAGDPEGIRYNTVFSLQDDLKSPFPLPLYPNIFDNFPHRIIRSIEGGTNNDSYRIFKALDYKDINKTKGDINNLFILNDSLYIHTERSLYKTQGKQTMDTSSGSAFVGSGDIFSQDPQEILSTDIGYGGNQFKFSNLTSRYGYIWIDYLNNRVYSLTDKIESISDNGMSNWFKTNLPFSSDLFNIDSPYNENGIHIIEDIKNKRILITKKEIVPTPALSTAVSNGDLIYTPAEDYWSSVVVTPTVYDLITDRTLTTALFETLWNNTNPDDQMIFQIQIGTWASFYVEDYVNAVSTPADTSNTLYFTPLLQTLLDGGAIIGWDMTITINPGGTTYTQLNIGASGGLDIYSNTYLTVRGWTISYQMDLKMWVSFHDYIPNMYLYMNDNLYSFNLSVPDSSGSVDLSYPLYEHGILTDMCNFYGTRHSFEFEFVDSAEKESTKVFTNIYYNIKVSDTTGTEYHRPGLTSFYVYNNNQMSDEIDLVYLQNIRNNEDTWTISRFRDMAAEVLDTYLSGTTNYLGVNLAGVLSTSNSIVDMVGMDQIINNSFIDASKVWNRQGKFISKYVNIHLISDNIDNKLLTLYFAGVSKRLSHR